MNNELVLFSQYDLCAVMEVTKSQMLKEIEEYPANQLLNTSPEDLADYFADKFEIVPLRALDDQIQADQEETKIDVSWDSSRYRGDRSGPFYVPGTLIMLHVPFEGNPDLFNCIPSHFSSNPPGG